MTEMNLDKKIETFFSQFSHHTYQKGELILQPDHNPLGAYYLQSGFVREYGISPQGLEISLHIFSPRSYFPMMWVISDIANRYYYEALSDVQVYSAPKEKLLIFLKENPEVLWELSRRIFAGLDKLVSRIEYLSYGKAGEKVISILLYLARHFGKEKNNKVRITQKFTHRDIGSLAALSRETVSREWEVLEKKGLITSENQHIVIQDVTKLKNELLG